MRKRWIRFGSLIFAVALAVVLPAQATGISDEDLDKLIRIDSLVTDPDSDLSLESGADALRTLFLLQVNATPAWRDLYQRTIDRILARLIEKVGGDVPNPGSGLHKACVEYEMLYRDGRWRRHVIPSETPVSIEEENPQQTQPAFQFSPVPPNLSRWTLGDFVYPLIAAVDFPKIVVRQARWSPDAMMLLFVLEPAEAPTVQTTFQITNIPTNYIAVLEQEGVQIAAIDEHAQASGKRIRNLAPGAIEITTTLEGPTRFTIRPE